MSKLRYILWMACAAGFMACGVNRLPIDDAYYYGEDEPAAEVSHESAATVQATPPVIEYTNVQDTTVTIKIKK